jgi:hypothetical protein
VNGGPIADGTTALARRMNHLANERGGLFDKAGANFGLSDPERQRLTAVEQELDECFMLRRQQRAAQNARRFARDSIPRTAFTRRTA